ncbi:MAG: TspO/MBR family protein [Pseudomonadota bacterium]
MSVVACLAAISIGGLFQPGEWYQTLQRAPWNPPGYVFGIAWSILYCMIALSGWIILKSQHASLISLWSAQLIINASWSWIFFGQKWVLIGMLVIALLIIMVGVLIIQCRRQVDLKWAGDLLIPYWLWLCLALSLNAYIWIYN